MQKEALVFLAKSLYFFEWKKVISFSKDERRSLMSLISLSLLKSLIFKFKELRIFEIFIGP